MNIKENITVKFWNDQSTEEKTSNGTEPSKKINESISSHINNELSFPPGFAGELAAFIYESSVRPVKEVSIVATLGLLSGIYGRAYTISGKGLNLFVLLVAKSGVGKEAMHSGIVKLFDQVEYDLPKAHIFADFDDYASAPALSKGVLQNPCFVNVVGEMGKKLKRMSRESDRNMQEIRTVLTNLYEKSGPQDKVPGIRYSNAENNALGTRGVAFSLIGETTPDAFLQALTPDMAADGFLSRFTVIEYDGPRPNLNMAPMSELNEPSLEKWKELLSKGLLYNSVINTPPRLEVNYADEDTRFKLHRFSLQCDIEVNATDDEWRRQMWSRAHMKALKIAALLACADDCSNPKINYRHVAWALDLVRRDIAMMTKHLDNGDVGNSDATRQKKIISICSKYLRNPVPAGYKVPEGMKEEAIITRAYLQIKTHQVHAFCDHKLGSVAALDLTIKSLVDDGFLQEIPKIKAIERFNSHAKCFRVLKID